MTGPRLTAEQRRALRVLADAGQNGATEAIMMACGFRREMLAGLVLAELATVVTRMIRAAGATTMKIDHYLITDDGRAALGES
jgi:hypothetical protein